MAELFGNQGKITTDSKNESREQKEARAERQKDQEDRANAK